MSMFRFLLPVVQTPAKRLGRGHGTGKGGHTVGYGTKGQSSRQGHSIPLWFEGGQLPMTRRLPFWRGKGRLESLHEYQEVQLSAIISRGLTEVSPETLKKAGLIRNAHIPVRVLGNTKVETALKVQGVAVTGPARAAIEAAGGGVQA